MDKMYDESIAEDLGNLIRTKTSLLTAKYPAVAGNESRCSLWSIGVKNNDVSRTLFDKAKRYYGRLWDYTRD